MIQKDIDLTKYLIQLIKESPDFVLKSESDLAEACFQYKGNLSESQEIEALTQKLAPALEADGRVFIAGTRLNRVFVLRACLINHRKDEASVRYLLDTIREIAQTF
jgi:aromatic-L-amino-acid/L-tryptophan decarboxylase